MLQTILIWTGFPSKGRKYYNYNEERALHVFRKSNYLDKLCSVLVGAIFKTLLYSVFKGGKNYTHNKLYKPRRPIPLKSVLGSSPWKPISHHCLEIRASNGESGFKHFHSYRREGRGGKKITGKITTQTIYGLTFQKSVLYGPQLHSYAWYSKELGAMH